MFYIVRVGPVISQCFVALSLSFLLVKLFPDPTWDSLILH